MESLIVTRMRAVASHPGVGPTVVETTVYTGALDTEPLQLMRMMASPASIMDAIQKAGGLAIDLTERMGKPAVYVRLPHDVSRGKQADTMANVARAKARREKRRHRRAVASTDPRLPMLTTGGGAQVGRMRYYATRRRPWPANARGPHSGAPCARRMYVFANDPAMRRLVEW